MEKAKRPAISTVFYAVSALVGVYGIWMFIKMLSEFIPQWEEIKEYYGMTESMFTYVLRSSSSYFAVFFFSLVLLAAGLIISRLNDLKLMLEGLSRAAESARTTPAGEDSAAVYYQDEELNETGEQSDPPVSTVDGGTEN